MPKSIKLYVRAVDRMNYLVGRATMYVIFVMIGVLFYSSVSKTFFIPALWTLEIAQFLMVAYFLLGGAYSIQLDGHVRMDLLYGSLPARTRNKWDTVTTLVMIGYLLVLLYGSISSLEYALQYNERSYSSWRPYMWPIKIVMLVGIILMLLQAIAQFFKDLAAARGESLS
jgi:TRAP-type mannitol/chloroaromatic compound transport system permease small subunit